jgi:hypothetical protein
MAPSAYRPPTIFGRVRQVALALLLSALVGFGVTAYAASRNYSGRVLAETAYSSTAVITSDYLVSDGNVDRLTFVVYSTQAGTAQVYYRGFGGEEVAIGSSTSITAATAEIIVLNFALPSTLVKFTPSAATAGTVWIDGIVGSHPKRTGG